MLGVAGGYCLLGIALAANLCEGYARAMIASEGGKMLDGVVARDFPVMLHRFILVILFIALMAAGILVKDSLLGEYLERGMVRIRKKTVEALDRAQLSWLDGYHTGRLSARVMADLNALGGALRPVLIMGISGVVHQFVCLVFMFITDWKLTLIVFAIVPVTTLLQWLSSHPIRKYRRANQDAIGTLSSVVFDCFGSFESVKSLSLEDEMRTRFAGAQEKQVAAAVSETRVVAALTLFSGINRYLPQLVLLLVGGAFVLHGRMTLGQLTMFLALSTGVIRRLGDIGDLFASMRQLGANAERIAELWGAPKEQEGGADERKSESRTALCFDHVSFNYRQGEEELLSDVSFTVKEGGFTALVGESGSGKSTVMKLAASLYAPREGSVSVLGRDIREWDLAALRSRIAYVSQDTYLFPGTLAENIRAGKTGGQEALLEECVRAAQLMPFVESLPAGLDTEVGERGVFLSGGQRQRISIARALYKRAELLFLDEATSALDRSTEEAMLRGILQMPGASSTEYRPTLIAITHSLANVRNADCIIVLDHGRIAETGTHETLCGKDGLYAAFLARQREDVEF